MRTTSLKGLPASAKATIRGAIHPQQFPANLREMTSLAGCSGCVPVASPLQSTDTSPMRGSAFDEISFFSAIEASGARALLIGRRALVVLGLPVLTADYDFWLHSGGSG